jgi:hypothetical protein
MHDLGEKIVVTKLDVGRRQLRTAIRLWFQDADPIPVHTLAYAAYEIIHVLSKKRDPYRDTLIFDADMIKDEYRQDWNDKIKKGANFFKHAKNDAGDSLEFMPSLTMLFIMGAMFGLRLMKEAPSTEEQTMFYWLCFHHPDWIKPDMRQTLKDRVSTEDIDHLRTVKKSDFLEAFDVGLKRHPAAPLNHNRAALEARVHSPSSAFKAASAVSLIMGNRPPITAARCFSSRRASTLPIRRMQALSASKGCGFRLNKTSPKSFAKAIDRSLMIELPWNIVLSQYCWKSSSNP